MISSLVEAAIRSIGVALIVGMGLRLFRVRNVLAQKTAWSLVLAAALAMPIAQSLPRNWLGLPDSMTVHLPASVWRQRQEAASQTATLHPRAAAQQFQIEQPIAGGNRFPALLVFQPDLNPAARDASSPVMAEAAPRAHGLSALVETLRQVRPLALAWGLYFVVLGLLLMRMGYGLAVAARIWHDAEPVLLDAALGFHSGLAVRTSLAVSSPVTVGSGVLLPANYEQWDGEKLRIVLAHEESHIRHGDFYLQVLAGLYGAMFWFSPLGWWLKRKLSELGEAISDLAGLEEAASRTSYAQLLLEFAALPRTTLTRTSLIGVAMARNSNLSLRIDRLLDESIFRQAFAGKRRLLLAVLLVPVALFAATVAFRVEAAESMQQTLAIGGAQSQAPAPAAPQEPLSGVSNPDAAPAPATTPAEVPATPAPPDVAAPAAPAPYPHAYGEIHDSADGKAYGQGSSQSPSTSESQDNVMTSGKSDAHGKHVWWTSHDHYSYSTNGDSWAVVSGPNKLRFSGDWVDGTRESIDKARKLAGGEFLWFTHDGKSYFIDDAAVVAQIQAMYKPMEELGAAQEALGLQQKALDKQQEELGRKHEQITVTVPDLSKEIAELNAAAAKLQAKVGSTVNSEELASVEAKAAAIQGRLGALQGELGVREGKLGELEGKLGEQEGKLGEEEGRLGEKEGKLAKEADRKVKSIIDQSLSNGKARPVQ